MIHFSNGRAAEVEIPPHKNMKISVSSDPKDLDFLFQNLFQIKVLLILLP